MMALSASEFFKNIKHFHQNIEDNFEQPSMIISKLRVYQLRAVKWIIDKEKYNDLIKSDGSPFSGGILADETGLGKTVEMLSCIISNTSPPEFYNKKIEVSKNYIQNTSTSNKLKPSTSKCVMDEDFILECYCMNASPNKTLVSCAMCGKKQHAECVNFEQRPFQEIPYLCPHCWTLNEKIQCKATLIIVPQSILIQWIEEIKKHIAKPGLKVFIYNGVHLDGYIQPISFNDYDLVITSYDNLSRDFKYIIENCDLENRFTSRLRNSKRYNYPQSPLSCIKWWRICLDESQVIESGMSKICEMISCLKSVHKWAITGTPIRKSLYDLYGILKILDVDPYYNRKKFFEFLKNDTSFVCECFSKVIWRNSVEDVNVELKLPNPTIQKHWLTFSEIEKCSYKTGHDIIAANFFKDFDRLSIPLDISLKNINKRTIYSILELLDELRQSCVYPLAVFGKLLNVKGTMPMDKLFDTMMEKRRVNCNNKLDSLIMLYNALAEKYIICNEPAKAIEVLRNSLHIIELNEEKNLQIKTFLKIRIMYNLSKLLDKYTEISRELSDAELKSNMELLKEQYLDSGKQNIKSAQKTVKKYLNEIAKLIGKKTLCFINWKVLALNSRCTFKEFLFKVKTELEDYRVPGVLNVANRLKSFTDVFNMLNNWLTDLNVARTNIISELKTLQKKPTKNNLYHSVSCNAYNLKSKKNFSKNLCLMCKTEYHVLAYESMLFNVFNQQKIISFDVNEIKDDEITSKSSWEMSQKEFLFMKLFEYVQTYDVHNDLHNVMKDSYELLHILNLLREECRCFRLLLSHISNSISAHKEILMIEVTLLTLFANQSQPSTNLSPLKKKIKMENDIIREYEIDCHINRIKSSIEKIGPELEKEKGPFLYLGNLKKKVNTTDVECPICTFNVDSRWAVLLCGHCICDKCLATMCDRSANSVLVCPMCRERIPMDSIWFAKSNQESDLVIKGSFSTKIECITLIVMKLIALDPNVKVLIFSTWDSALFVLGQALESNSINYRILKSGNKYKKTLTDFKTNTKINALLMMLSLDARGLYLTKVTNVIFMEPVINKADEYRAINRMHSTKPTFVHHFIVRDSVEENISNIISRKQLNEWDDITLSQMKTVFERNSCDPET